MTELSATLFKETDIDRSGDISLTELCEGFRRNEHLFKVLSLRFDNGFLFFDKTIKPMNICVHSVRAVGSNQNGRP